MKSVIFQTIQFSISTQFSSIWHVDRSLSEATTLGQSGLGSDGNDGVHCIPQSSRITGTLTSDCLMSYSEYSCGGGVLHLRRNAVCVFYSPGHWACESPFVSSQLNGFKYSYLTLKINLKPIIFLDAVKCFQLSLLKSTNSIHQLLLSDMNNLHRAVWFQ